MSKLREVVAQTLQRLDEIELQELQRWAADFLARRYSGIEAELVAPAPPSPPRPVTAPAPAARSASAPSP